MVSFNYKSYKNIACTSTPSTPHKICLEIVFLYVKFSKLNKYLTLLGLQQFLYNLCFLNFQFNEVLMLMENSLMVFQGPGMLLSAFSNGY